MTLDFPIMLYRHKPGCHVIWGVECETTTVADDDELKAALAKGFKLSPADADPKAILADRHPTELAQEKQTRAERAQGKDDHTTLRAEYEKLAGKKPFGGWDAAKLYEKIKELKK